MGWYGWPVANSSTTARVALALTGGTRSEAELNDALGRSCDVYHHVGDKIGNSSLSHPENEWILNAPPSDADRAEDAVEAFVAELSPLTGKIAALEDVDVTLSIEITSDEKVGLYLEADVIGALTLMGAALDLSVTAA